MGRGDSERVFQYDPRKFSKSNFLQKTVGGVKFRSKNSDSAENFESNDIYD